MHILLAPAALVAVQQECLPTIRFLAFHNIELLPGAYHLLRIQGCIFPNSNGMGCTWIMVSQFYTLFLFGLFPLCLISQHGAVFWCGTKLTGILILAFAQYMFDFFSQIRITFCFVFAIFYL